MDREEYFPPTIGPLRFRIRCVICLSSEHLEYRPGVWGGAGAPPAGKNRSLIIAVDDKESSLVVGFFVRLL